MSLYKMHDEKETEVCFWSRPLNTKVTRPSLSSAIQGEMTNDWLYSSNKSVAIGPGNSQAIYSVKLIIFGGYVFLPEFTGTTSSSSFFSVGFFQRFFPIKIRITSFTKFLLDLYCWQIMANLIMVSACFHSWMIFYKTFCVEPKWYIIIVNYFVWVLKFKMK